jgi:GNAT superfamily N-acetyltransferase
MSTATRSTPQIRQVLRPGDLEAIVAHHRRIYGAEHRVDSTFESHVAATVSRAAERGFPGPREAIRIVERDGTHAGSLALTEESDDVATLRWFVLDAELRGQGLGRRLLGELMEAARRLGYRRISLETFSELETAAHLYRSRGFRLRSEDSAPRWGRERITYQRYEAELGAATSG